MNYPPLFTTYDSFSPVFMQQTNIQSNEYIEGEEDFGTYRPLNFDILSIVLNAIERYRDINEEDWLGSGYKRPLKQTFSNTRDFLISLPERYLYYLQTEDIEPTPYGTFVLDFIGNNYSTVSIEVGKDKVGYFTKYSDKENSMSPGIVVDKYDVPKEIIEALEGILA